MNDASLVGSSQAGTNVEGNGQCFHSRDWPGCADRGCKGLTGQIFHREERNGSFSIGFKQIVKSDVSVGAMQMQPQAVEWALKETPEIAAWFGASVFLSPPEVGSKAMADGLYNASATNKSLSVHLGASFLKIMERDVRAGLRDRGVTVGSSPPAGAAVVYLSSLVATAYTTSPGQATAGFSNGSVSWTSVNREFYSYGLTATSRMSAAEVNRNRSGGGV